jgi:hypothetical protein
MWYDGGDKKVVKRKRKEKEKNFGLKLAQLPFPSNDARKLVGYFKCK